MPRIIPRSEHHLVAEPPTSRSKVVRPTGWVLTHYTGGGGSTTDGKSDAQHMAELAAYARNAKKPWEYNYVITAPLGFIWEMAGVYRGAHCQGFNEQSLSVQMNLGVGAAPNAAMIAAHRWLREELTRTGQWRRQAPSAIAGADGNVPHYRFRSTSCCGSMMASPPGASWGSPTGEGSIGNLQAFMIAPYSSVPLPPTGGTDDVAFYWEDGAVNYTTDAAMIKKRTWPAGASADFVKSIISYHFGADNVINMAAGTAAEQATRRATIASIPEDDKTSDDAAMAALATAISNGFTSTNTVMAGGFKSVNDNIDAIVVPPGGGGGANTEADIRAWVKAELDAAAARQLNG